MSTTRFGLYPTPACIPTQRVQVGAGFVLDTPVGDSSAQVFRRSLWLKVPADAAKAETLRLVASALKLRFSAARFSISIGKPSSPCLRLILESLAGAPEVLLWQALAPGEHGSIELPAQPLAEEWAAALEQLLAKLASITPHSHAVLRLDIESDAPCAISLVQASFGLAGEFTLLEAPLRFDFDGARALSHVVELAPIPPATYTIVLEGRLDGATAPTADGWVLGAQERTGVLLEADTALVRTLALMTPAALTGLAIAWHPLTDHFAGIVRVFADGGSRPAAQALVEASFAIDSVEPGWIMVRWSALELQPQPLWLQLSVLEGSGIWLADPAAAPVGGWHGALAASAAARSPLGLAPRCAWLDLAPDLEGASNALTFRVGLQISPPVRKAGRFSIELAGAPIEVSCAAPARLIIERARATVRIA